MQIRKEDIRKNILRAARTEFQTKGFKDASMRTIASCSSVGLSNIYNYFRNKDEIFCEVLSELIVAIDYLTQEHNTAESIDLYVLNSDEYVQGQIRIFFDIVSKYKEEFELLLFKSTGSSLECFLGKYIDHHTKTGIEYIRRAHEKYSFVNTNISPFFIRTMSSWWMSIIGELVWHNLSDDELEQFIAEYVAFGTAGWKKIMNIKG